VARLALMCVGGHENLALSQVSVHWGGPLAVS